MDKIDLIIEQQKEMRSDIKAILQKLPTYQTKDKCVLNHKDITNSNKNTGKFIIATIIATLTGLSGLVIGIINIIKNA